MQQKQRNTSEPNAIATALTKRYEYMKHHRTHSAFAVRWQADRDTALDIGSKQRIESAVAASLCRRTPKVDL